MGPALGVCSSVWEPLGPRGYWTPDIWQSNLLASLKCSPNFKDLLLKKKRKYLNNFYIWNTPKNDNIFGYIQLKYIFKINFVCFYFSNMQLENFKLHMWLAFYFCWAALVQSALALV